MSTPLNIIGGWYSDEAKPWSQQDICNYIPFVAEQSGTLSPVKAVPAPGLKPFVQIASNGGVRGAENVEGKLLVVAGTTLYQIGNTGVAIPRGTIPGTGLVTIDYNQSGIANQVLIGNGSAGYVYDTSALTLTRITDPAFPGTKAVDYLDSYLLGVEPLGRFWFHSNLADAEDYNALDRYEAETSPDRIVTLAVSNEEVVVFGQTTTDFFVNTGATTGTFQSKGVSMAVGCAAAASVVKLDNTLFWLDNYGVFQRLNGYSPQPVSTRVLEAAISGFDWNRCRAMVYQDKGRKIVYWTFPGQLTIGFDVTTGLWHRRAAYGMQSDRLSCIVNWNRKWIGGDYINGRMYELDWDYMLQVDQPHVRRITTAPLAGNGNRITLHKLKLVFDSGGPETIAIPFPEQPESPVIAGSYPDGVVGEELAEYTYTATGGTPPYTFTNRPGNNPAPGITAMASNGVVAESTPTEAGSYTHRPRVTDANGLYDDLVDPYVIEVAPVDWLMQVDGLLYGVNGDWSNPPQPSPGSFGWGVVGWGNGELLMSDRGDNVAWSPDKGTNWTVSTLPETVSGNRGYVLYANGYWWVPSGTITPVQRGDGITFTQPASGAAAEGESIAKVMAEPLDTLVMVAPFQASASRSTDNGATWAFGSGDMKTGAVEATRVGIASNGTRCVIGGDFAGGYIAYSDNSGDTWVAVSSGFLTGNPSYVTCRGGKFVMGTTTGQICFSDNGEDFELAGATGTALRCNGIDYDGTRWTAIFADSSVLGYVVESLDDMATWDVVTPWTGDTAQFGIVAMTP